MAINIILIPYPNATGDKIKVQAVPARGEKVFYNSRYYAVTDVIHNIDEKVIKVMVQSVK